MADVKMLAAGVLAALVGAGATFYILGNSLKAAEARFEKGLKAVEAKVVMSVPSTNKVFPPVAKLLKPLRILVTGGAGFVGSNLVDVLMQQVRVKVGAGGACTPSAALHPPLFSLSSLSRARAGSHSVRYG